MMVVASPPTNETDPEDIFLDSLQSLYDYTPITYSSAGSDFQYALTETHRRLQATSASSTISLATPNTEANNWSLHASSIWASSVFLADHLDALRLEQHILAARKRGQERLQVLELGAGAGLPSILIAKCFDEVDIVASDYPDSRLVGTLRANIERNDVQRCRVVPYAWGSDPSVFIATNNAGDGTEKADVIIAADTLWNPDFHGLFLKTLQTLLRKTDDARAYLIAGLHTGRYTLQAFMDDIERFGLMLEEAEEKEVSGLRSRLWNVSRAEGEDDKERRRWVVWMKIKWKALPK